MGVNQEKMANLDGVWNTKGDKYAVAASSGNVYVGRYHADNNFWVAHAVTKKSLHKASVVCVRFDPQSGRVVASASLDGSVTITSAYLEDLDKDSTAGPFGNVTAKFGESLMSISSSSWINGLAFSFDSKLLSYVSQDCEINFVDVTECAGGKSKPKSEKVLHRGNPHMNC